MPVLGPVWEAVAGTRVTREANVLTRGRYAGLCIGFARGAPVTCRTES